MHDDESTDVASFASPRRVVPLHQAADLDSRDHLTWAYQTHVTAIYQYVYTRVGNRPDAEDLTSQVFMKATKAMRSDVSLPQLRSWLYRVAQTTLVDHWREYCGYSVRETARELGLSETNVKVLQFRALNRAGRERGRVS